MKTIPIILAIFLAQCTYLYAEPILGEPIFDSISNSCIFGVKSVSIFLSNRHAQHKNIKINEICDNIDPLQPIVFLVHGFISSANTSRFQELAEKLKQKNYTVLALDWSQAACTNGIPLIKLANYPNAVMNTREIAQLMANYTIFLINQCNVPLENITYIGHSLGAHVSGLAAKIVYKIMLSKVPRIVAADPAGVLFDNKKCEERLCSSDAEYLICIHTSPLGMSKVVGHLDLFFNGGKMQPGCKNLDFSCAHSRSVDYIIDIIEDNNCGFPGVSNNSPNYPNYPNSSTTDCIIVNDKILEHGNSIKGKYYVFCNNKYPYCTQQIFNCEQQ